jgi:uncharacterized protein
MQRTTFAAAAIATATLLAMACTSNTPPTPNAPPVARASSTVFDAIQSHDADALARALDGNPRLASERDAKGTSPTLAALFQINADAETFAKPQDNVLLRVVASHGPTLDIFDAAALGDVSRLRELIGGDATLVDAFQPSLGVTPLQLAAFAGQVAAMELLLANGAKVDAISNNIFHNTALILATLTSQHEAASLLLARGANPNVSEKGGERALHIAAAADDAPMIQLLLGHGAAVSATNDDGMTPLDVARKKGRARAQHELENQPRSP